MRMQHWSFAHRSSPEYSWSTPSFASRAISSASSIGCRRLEKVPARAAATSGPAGTFSPSFAPVACWAVEQRNGRIFVTAKRQAAIPAKAVRTAPGARSPSRIVIIGGGAAGFAAAVTLRRHQYDGSIIMLSSDDAPPVDRPNLSKDYLAGNAPEEWVPLRPDGFYAENGIDLRLQAEVVDLNLRTREVGLAGGEKIAYDRLLLATGAEPIRLSIPGADLPHVHTLRSLADCRAIIARPTTAMLAVELGASFIGLEVAALLRAREIEVHV